MTIEDYDLVGSYNNQRIFSIDSERSVNLFEYRDLLAKKKKMLIPTSGIEDQDLDFGITSGGFRTSFFFNNQTFHVIGNAVWLIQGQPNTLSPIQLNPTLPLTTSSGYIGIDANTFQIIFVDGVKGYIYDTIALTFKQIVDTSFPAIPLDVCNLDGFFVVANGNTNNFQLSSFNQGMVWGAASNNFTVPTDNTLTIGNSTIGGVSGTVNFPTGVPFTVTATGSGAALPPELKTDTVYYSIQVDSTTIQVATSYMNAIVHNFIPIAHGGGRGTFTIISNGQLQQGSITTHPGTIVACRTLHRRLFLFSQFFTEVWENAGIGLNLPFRRNNSVVMEYGTTVASSIATGFDKMFFQAQDKDGLGPVMEVIGVEAIPISNKALDFQLARYAALGQISDCRTFLIRENGIIFFRMNFTLANHTFIYDVTQSDPTQEVSRLWHEEEMLDGSRHVAQTHVYYNGINYVGHYSMPIIYEIDSDIYTNDGDSIHRYRIGKPFVPPGYQRIRVNRFQIDLLQGSLQEDTVFTRVDLLTENFINIITEPPNGLRIATEQTFLSNINIKPILFLSLSKDGGQTYGSLIPASMGLSGDRKFRTLWRKLGTTVRGQAFVPRIDFYNPIPFFVLGAAWDYEVLPE